MVFSKSTRIFSNLIQFQKVSVGRRIIDVEYFGEQLNGGCKTCLKPLSINFIKEKILALSSVFHIRCKKCNNITKIRTSRKCKGDIHGKERQPYSINAKLIIGMIHAGLGASHINKLLTSLGIPAISTSGLKKLERRIGPLIEGYARRSCESAATEEYRLATRRLVQEVEKDDADWEDVTEDSDNSMTFDEIMEQLLSDDNADENRLEEESTPPYSGKTSCENHSAYESYQCTTTIDGNQCTQIVTETDSNCSTSYTDSPIDLPMPGPSGDSLNLVDTQPSCSYSNLDSAGDNSRPTMCITVSQDCAWSKRGRAMNSRAGFGHVIGKETKMCINYGTRVKGCKKCAFYESKNETPPVHDCRRNWNKSAKAMEPDIAVQLHAAASKDCLLFDKVIGDEDSSSIKSIREKVNPDLEKYQPNQTKHPYTALYLY